MTAIALDFDLETDQGCRDARALLDQLRSSAEAEAIVFDASGTGGRAFETELPAHADTCTDSTSLSNGVAELSISDWSSETTGHVSGSSGGSGVVYGMAEEENMPLEQQVTAMLAIFPSATDFSVRHTLKKCAGNWNRAMDELLNQQFLAEPNGEGYLPAKGIDAFTEGTYSPKTNKKNRRNKRRDRTQMSTEELFHDMTSQSPSSAANNVWTSSKQDIDFIASRIDVPYKTVASLYHSHAASVPTTIIAILESTQAKEWYKVSEDDTMVQVNAADLGEEFPTIAHQHLLSLICLTHPSTATAHEIAKELTRSPRSVANRKNIGGISVIPSYAPLNLAEDDDSDQAWSHAGTSKKKTTSTDTHEQEDAALLASHYSAQQSRAFAQASAAYRRGKSDHLMGAAAGYYSQVGRDMATRKREATAGAADALVAANSTRDTVDLHGISVLDAVRITRIKVEEWWRARRGVKGLDGRLGEMSGGDGLRVITGQGRHSVGGIGKIGPAVGRMLLNEGWRVVVDPGMYTVLGKRR